MTQPQDDEWGSPQSSGEFVAPAKVEGHLLIVYPTGYVPHISTVHSRPDKLSDAVRVDVVDLDEPDEQGELGKVYRNSNWMQAVLIASLRPEIGRKVLGVMSKGVGKKGFNAPWVLTDMSGDQEARNRAKAWLAAHPNFTPSRFVDGGSAPTATEKQTSTGGYSPTPQEYTAAAPASTPSPAPNYVPVPGSPHQVTEEEISLLQQLRAQRAAREASVDPNGPPPF